MSHYFKPIIFTLIVASIWSCSSTRLTDCPDASKNKALKKHQKYLDRIRPEQSLTISKHQHETPDVASTNQGQTIEQKASQPNPTASGNLTAPESLTASSSPGVEILEPENQQIDEVTSLLESLTPKQQKKLDKLQKRIEKKTSKLEAQGKASSDVNGLAIASFITGIVGLFIFGYLLGALAIIFGAVALSKIKKTGQGGRGLAIAGLIMGIVGILALTIILA